MTLAAEFDVDAKRMMRLLDKLPDAVNRRVSRKAVTAGSKPILDAQKSEVPVDEGTLRKSLGRKTKVYRASQTAVAMTGPRVKGGHMGYHGHLVNDGHVNVDGTFTPGNPFLNRAQDKAAGQAQSRLIATLAAGIESEAAKL